MEALLRTVHPDEVPLPPNPMYKFTLTESMVAMMGPATIEALLRDSDNQVEVPIHENTPDEDGEEEEEEESYKAPAPLGRPRSFSSVITASALALPPSPGTSEARLQTLISTADSVASTATSSMNASAPAFTPSFGNTHARSTYSNYGKAPQSFYPGNHNYAGHFSSSYGNVPVAPINNNYVYTPARPVSSYYGMGHASGPPVNHIYGLAGPTMRDPHWREKKRIKKTQALQMMMHRNGLAVPNPSSKLRRTLRREAIFGKPNHDYDGKPLPRGNKSEDEDQEKDKGNDEEKEK